jgi:hypothetical protein
MRVLGSILLVVLLVSLIPIRQRVAPAWTIEVVDEAGSPRPGIIAREVWRQYSLEAEGHEEDIRTGVDGLASFPPRMISRPYIANVLGAIRNLLTLGVHASFGPEAHVIAFANGNRSFVGNPNGAGTQRIILAAGAQ